MSNSNFYKNGVDKSRTHCLEYAAFVVTAFAIYFGLTRTSIPFDNFGR